MYDMTIAKDVIKRQQACSKTQQCRDVENRIQRLKTLKCAFKEYEQRLQKAVHADLGKSSFEFFMTEMGLVYQEINYFIANTKRLSKPTKVSTNLANFPARSSRVQEPLGCVLVIGAWNYPLQLSILPVVSALAAGNTVILKPSELAPHTAACIAEMCNNAFDAEVLYVAEGGVEYTTELLEHRFDKIFFTGSSHVGKVVYQAAAKHLTPVTFELGGKSPAFVLADTDIAMTVRRLVWAKFLNAGQTCVAPDYVMVDDAIRDEFLSALVAEIQRIYPKEPVLSDQYVRIINDRHMQRLCNLIDVDKVLYGGAIDVGQRIITPTVLDNVSFDDAIMQEEIFGPILPVLTFTNLTDALALVKEQEKPLACYVYGSSGDDTEAVMTELSFGSGAVNDSMMQLSNHHLPFGGVGNSGMGSYHGKYGFQCFSHYKSILKKPLWFEAPIKYAPYSGWKRRILTWLMR